MKLEVDGESSEEDRGYQEEQIVSSEQNQNEDIAEFNTKDDLDREDLTGIVFLILPTYWTDLNHAERSQVFNKVSPNFSNRLSDEELDDEFTLNTNIANSPSSKYIILSN
jgi:hypothetical protein